MILGYITPTYPPTTEFWWEPESPIQVMCKQSSYILFSGEATSTDYFVLPLKQLAS